MKKSVLIFVAIIFATGAFAQTKYKVGDVSAELGGIVIYVDLTGEHGIVCPDLDQGDFEWGCDEKLISGADGTGLYDGKQNTKDILAGCHASNSAAKICDNLVLYGKSDWYLPSKYELNLMYKNLHKKGIGNFDNVRYWSSTEYAKFKAWGQYFSDGDQYYTNKNATYRVRAVRAF